MTSPYVYTRPQGEGMRVGVDLDGVLYPFDQVTRLVCEQATGRTLPQPIEYNYWHEWGLTGEEFWQIVGDSIEAGFVYRQGEPTDGAVDALHEMRTQGHTIHLCTARRRAEVETVLWLREHDVPFDSLTFSHDKRLIDVDIFVDDYERNWRDVHDHGRAMSLLFDQSWNQHVDAGDLRVRSFDEVSTFADCLAALRMADA